MLQPIDVPVGRDLVGPSVRDGEIRVEALGRCLRLPHDDAAERDEDDDERCRERQVHESDRDAATDPERAERPDDRVEQQRYQCGHAEEEHRVSGRLRERPGEEHEHRQPDELNPAGDLDSRRAGLSAHADDRTRARGPARPPAWDWSWAEDGALALDPDASWEPPQRPAATVTRLNGARPSGTVLGMPPPRAQRRAVRARRRSHAAERRRLAVVIAIALVALGTLLVTAFGGGDHPNGSTTGPASASRLLPAGPPTLQAVSRLGTLTLDLPVNQRRITAVGYFAASDGALALTPIGTQANQGLLRRLVHAIVGGGSGSPHWYLLPGGDGPSTSALDVGAAPGTDVYSPVDGTIVGIEQVTLDGQVHGQRIEIQPNQAPSLVVAVAGLAADPALAVGAQVTAGSTKLGVLIDLSKVEKQSLARYTNDAGNHVLVEVHPAATLDIR